MSMADALRDVTLFSQLRDDDLARIGEAARRRTYSKNSIILLQHNPVDGLYLVVQGRVKLVQTAEDGREVILSTRSVGDFFGEMSLVDNEPSATTVIAMDDSEILVLRREDFQRCLEAMPQISFGLMRSLCSRLRQADRRISSLTLLDVPQRVAHLLLELADENDGVHVLQPLTHQVIAQIVGSSRETVTRTMRQLVTDGLISVSRKSVAMPNRRRGEAPGGTTIQVQRRVITVLDRARMEEAAART
jgi:CRP/FNR family cyclic AMP-dependent transcriptional regulator